MELYGTIYKRNIINEKMFTGCTAVIKYKFSAFAQTLMTTAILSLFDYKSVHQI